MLEDKRPVEECLQVARSIRTRGEIFVRMGRENRGASSGLESGIDWIFSHEERAVILEDDLMASRAFFRFCDMALEEFEHDDRFGAVCGWTPLKEPPTNPPSPLWGKYAWTWGWGTFRRIWEMYRATANSSIESSLNIQNSTLLQRSHAPLASHYWQRKIRLLDRYDLDAWDFKFNMTLWRHHLLVIQPPFPLVENVGFDSRSTNLQIRPKFIKELDLTRIESDAWMHDVRDLDVDLEQENDMWGLSPNFSIGKYLTIWISYWILQSPVRTRWYRRAQQLLSRT